MQPDHEKNRRDVQAQVEAEIIKSNDKLAWLIDQYAEYPWIRALLQIATGTPGVGGLFAAASELLNSAVHERRKVFFDELARGEYLLSQEIIQTEEFLQMFVVSYSAAIRTYQREKIRHFARLLLRGAQESPPNVDRVEEFVSILDDLSGRELHILLTLKRFEDQNKTKWSGESQSDIREAKIRQIGSFWEDFEQTIENEIGVYSSFLSPMLIRLTRTGLFETITGRYNHREGNGILSPQFDEFAEWIKLTNKSNE